MKAKPVILGLAIFTLSTLAQAIGNHPSNTQPVSKETVKETAKEKQPLFPALPNGSRIANGNLKDEFYILTEDQKDPPRSTIVNSQPMEAGLGAETLLGQDAETVVDANNLVHENTAEVTPPSSPPDVASEDSPAAFFEASIPSDDQLRKINADSEYAEEQDARGSNIAKVKQVLHKMTRKIADKKKQAKTKARLAQAARMRQAKIKAKKLEVAAMRERFVSET